MNPSLGEVLAVGDCGINCGEIGDVVGVCAEAPLPRIAVREEAYSLAGVGGIASQLRRWGCRPAVCIPLGDGLVSDLQRKVLRRECISFEALLTGKPQVIRLTRRIFAGGHQHAHLETEERVPPRAQSVNQDCVKKLIRTSASFGLLCVLDCGISGLDERLLGQIVGAVRQAKTQVLYEPRHGELLKVNNVDFLKVNQNQVSQWFGVTPQNDKEALAALARIARHSTADALVYSRGERGILVLQRVNKQHKYVFIEPIKQSLYDLISAGDVLTAGLAFGISRGYSLLEASCLAVSAAELSLDRRHDNKLLDLDQILSR